MNCFVFKKIKWKYSWSSRGQSWWLSKYLYHIENIKVRRFDIDTHFPLTINWIYDCNSQSTHSSPKASAPGPLWTPLSLLRVPYAHFSHNTFHKICQFFIYSCVSLIFSFKALTVQTMPHVPLHPNTLPSYLIADVSWSFTKTWLTFGIKLCLLQSTFIPIYPI